MRVEEIVAEKDGFGKWIPCSERLPENDTNVIALLFAWSSDRIEVCRKWYF